MFLYYLFILLHLCDKINLKVITYKNKIIFINTKDYNLVEAIMAIEKVKEYFSQWNMEKKIKEFEVSSETVELAAIALKCNPDRIAKTLSFMVEGEAVLIVSAGDAKIDNPKYKAYFKTKAKMLTPDEVVSLIGHSVGGVCPFGINPGVNVYLDKSLKRFDSVFPACGSSNSAIELSIPELEKYSGYIEWIDVCKGWNDNY
jgi:prolyl-tRNA editing enzyme YbaK/EbsC (Cys-tRNA(Pro) deacylase)